MRILFGDHVLIVDGETATFDGNVVDMHKLASLDQGRCLYTGSVFR